MSNINRSRGCTIKMHSSGFRVVMYKDDPGVYYDERGEEIADTFAKQAGFDVEDLGRQRRKKQRLAHYQAQVEEEFATDQEDTERLLSTNAAGLEVKHVGGGKYAILDGEGDRLTKKPLTKDEAQQLIEDMQNGGEDDGSTS